MVIYLYLEGQRRFRNRPIAKTHSSQVGVAEVETKAMMATRATVDSFMMTKEDKVKMEMVKDELKHPAGLS